MFCGQLAPIAVMTVAGSGENVCMDGVGTDAAFIRPEGICYSKATDSLLIVETEDSNRVRRFFPGYEQQKSELRRLLTSTLLDTDSLKIVPIISIILDFAMGNSTCCSAGLFGCQTTECSFLTYT